ncbi:hypothetical protein [Croceicoccus mobilis]|uniref:Argininosuccinate lyase n=1 Tax=Croceicoccus mobilis TaxID=1703339 RepID=A0A916Z1Q1_9SPHN|nr:hypothetical protein [Croceicoccus mobilis]GGD71897.1 hypothetical protein GCM10010990_21680 [Croceicoccus mobilis]
MRIRLAAAPVCMGMCLCALAACGEAVPSPAPADADEAKILSEAAEMIPASPDKPDEANPETNPALTR